MPSISLSADASQATNTLTRYPAHVRVALRGAVEDGTTYVLAKVKRYPPQRPGSSYIRTHILEKSWSRRVMVAGDTVTGVVGSNGGMAPYNRVVMSRPEQAAIHRNFWPTVEDIIEQSQPTVQRMFMDRLRTTELR